LVRAIAEPSLPFFIEWAPLTELPGHSTIDHPAGRARITKLAVDADARRLAGWLGDHHLPITVRPGGPAVTAVYISSDAGEIVIDSVAD
jgi:hypothetical protein